MIALRVHGEPAPQGSKVRTRYGMRESSTKVAPWRQAVVAAVLAQRGATKQMTGPVYIEVDFLFHRPKSHYGTGRNAGTLKDSAPRHPTKPPDIDKLLRSTFDGLTDSGLWADDSLAVMVSAVKKYVPYDVPQGASILIKDLFV